MGGDRVIALLILLIHSKSCSCPGHSVPIPAAHNLLLIPLFYYLLPLTSLTRPCLSWSDHPSHVHLFSPLFTIHAPLHNNILTTLSAPPSHLRFRLHPPITSHHLFITVSHALPIFITLSPSHNLLFIRSSFSPSAHFIPLDLPSCSSHKHPSHPCTYSPLFHRYTAPLLSPTPLLLFSLHSIKNLPSFSIQTISHLFFLTRLSLKTCFTPLPSPAPLLRNFITSFTCN